MLFRSTRADESIPAVGLEAALQAGLAPDGGLYVPLRLPWARIDEIPAALTPAPIAERGLRLFFAGSRLQSALNPMLAEAFAPPLALVDAGPDMRVLQLFHGPTAAFKDFAARFLAAALQRLQPEGKVSTVLVATSGDTGAAVAAAFHRRPGFKVVILYPDGRVSARQAHQLGCFGDNVSAFRVAGSFDDCQRLAKQAFADEALRERVNLTSANSISIGRLLPQIGYYAWASVCHWRERHDLARFVVPTGNFGNALACLLARDIGFPIEDVALASNANATLPEYFASGVYRGRDSVATLANAMDVGDPSNFERFAWFAERSSGMRQKLTAEAVDDDTIRARIREGESRYGQVWCPHTACAVEVRERIRARGDTRNWIVVATAHPAKFDTIVEPLIGHSVDVPPALAELLSRPTHSASLEPTVDALRAVL